MPAHQNATGYLKHRKALDTLSTEKLWTRMPKGTPKGWGPKNRTCELDAMLGKRPRTSPRTSPERSRTNVPGDTVMDAAEMLCLMQKSRRRLRKGSWVRESKAVPEVGPRARWIRPKIERGRVHPLAAFKAGPWFRLRCVRRVGRACLSDAACPQAGPVAARHRSPLPAPPPSARPKINLKTGYLKEP